MIKQTWELKYKVFLSISKRFSRHSVHFWISGQSSASIYHRLWEHKFWQCQRFPEGLLSSSQGRHQYGGGFPEQVRARPHVWWPPEEGEDASLIFLCKYLLRFNQSLRMIIFSRRDWWIRPYLLLLEITESNLNLNSINLVAVRFNNNFFEISFSI